MTLLIALLACADKAPNTDTAAPGETGETGSPDPGFECPAVMGDLQDVTTTPASPYLIHHPTAPEDTNGDIVIFLGGGSGDRGSADYGFKGFLDHTEDLERIWAVLPYTTDGELQDEGDRVVAVAEEVLACYGGDPARVHLAGTSNGGYASFEILLEHPDPFATLLGAPGLFTTTDPDVLSAALAGKRVFNGVGSEDTDWQPYVEATHELLLELGVDSTYQAFEGQGHIPDESFDKTPLYAFWLETEG